MSTHSYAIDLTVEIEFDYHPAEPPERGPEAQYPGCDEEWDITGLWIDGQNIIAHLTEETKDYLVEVLRDYRDTPRQCNG